MGRNFTREQTTYCCLCLMWLFIGFLTALFLKRGPILDHGKPILVGIVVEVFVGFKFGKFAESINLMILESIAGLATGSSIVMLWTGFLLSRPASTFAGIKWLVFGLVSFVLFLVALKQIPSVFSPEAAEPQLPDGFETWTEIQRLEHLRDTLLEPIVQTKPNYRHPRRLVGALFMFVGLCLMIQIILKTESRSEQLIMILILVMLAATMPFLVRFINKKIRSKFDGIIGDIDEIRTKMRAEVVTEIDRLKSEQGNSA